MYTKRKILIEVTEDDIRTGKIQSCYTCPIAIAINRKTNIEMGVLLATTVSKDSTFGTLLPRAAQQFITLFDRKQKVSPFSFELEIPTSYLK